MSKLALQQFKGIIPKIPPKLLNSNNAQIADNCRLDRGHLESWQSMSKVGDLTKTGDIQTIHLFADQYWFHWAEDVDVVKAPIAGDTEEKTVFTVNDGNTTKPKITDSTAATSGGSGDIDNYPTTYYNLGIPRPASALTAANSPSCDEADQETVVYIYTYVNEYGFEGPPSPPSNSVDRCSGDTVDLSNMETGPDGNYKTSEWGKRVYRTVSGIEDTEYQFVMNVGIASTSATDSLDTDELGEIIPSMDWIAPPDDLQGIVALPNGIMAGFSGKDLYFSEPYIPSAWPTEYSLSTDEPIVGLGWFGTSLVVCTEGVPYLVSGSHPANMSMSYLGVHQACVSKRGIVSIGPYGVLYPSPDGLVMVTSDGAKVITSGILTRGQWQSYSPESVKGYDYNGQYFGFYNNGTEKKGFVLDPSDPENGFKPLNIYANAGFTDLETDTLYLVTDNDTDGTYDELMQWEGGTGKLSYRWKSKVFTIPNMNFTCCQVIGESYNDLTFKLYASGQVIFTTNVTDGKVFRLPGGDKHREFEIELTGTDIVNEVYIATSIMELHSFG